MPILPLTNNFDIQDFLDHYLPIEKDSIIPPELQNLAKFSANRIGLHVIVNKPDGMEIITVHPIGFFVSSYIGNRSEGKLFIKLVFLDRPDTEEACDFDNIQELFPKANKEQLGYIKEYIATCIMRLEPTKELA